MEVAGGHIPSEQEKEFCQNFCLGCDQGAPQPSRVHSVVGAFGKH